MFDDDFFSDYFKFSYRSTGVIIENGCKFIKLQEGNHFLLCAHRGLTPEITSFKDFVNFFNIKTHINNCFDYWFKQYILEYENKKSGFHNSYYKYKENNLAKVIYKYLDILYEYRNNGHGDIKYAKVINKRINYEKLLDDEILNILTIHNLLKKIIINYICKNENEKIFLSNLKFQKKHFRKAILTINNKACFDSMIIRYEKSLYNIKMNMNDVINKISLKMYSEYSHDLLLSFNGFETNYFSYLYYYYSDDYSGRSKEENEKNIVKLLNDYYTNKMEQMNNYILKISKKDIVINNENIIEDTEKQHIKNKNTYEFKHN